MIDVLPGILEHDLPHFLEKFHLVCHLASWFHIDIADGTLVDNTTYNDFETLGEALKKESVVPSLEAHLMVTNPEKYIRKLTGIGFKRLIAHIECQDPRRFLEETEHEEVEVGLALDGPNSVEEIEPFLEELDVALIMGYEAGYSGQPFQPETLEKLKQIHHHFPEVLLEVDGGVTDKTAPAIVDAGATRLVTTSYLFTQSGEAGMEHALQMLRDLG